MMLVIFLLQFCFFSTPSLSADLPPYINICKKTEPDMSKCMVDSTDNLMPYLVRGIPELNYPPVDPLHCRNVSVTIGESSIKIEAHLANGVITGLKDMKMLDCHPNFDTGVIETKVIIPKMNLKADYNLKGKILLFDIDGEGITEFNSTNMIVIITQYGRYHTKEGAKYMKFDKTSIKVDAEDMSVNFSNLFRNNEAITQSINQAINDNIKTLKEELDILIAQTIETVVIGDYVAIYDMFPIDTLFPN
ncbi:hypothetical protein RI129_005391 [Pyrocoelia pectoralis]|uniref:Uncharacterized protein n=1 Tax=Pyrocoelia pectoralis TaxID=417401 RepID=A0AAN7ZLH5_9COLE